MKRLKEENQVHYHAADGLPHWRLSVQEFAADYVISLRGLDLDHISVLDLGCGTGYTLIRLSSMLSSNAKLVGIDIDSVAISEAEAHAKQIDGNARIEFRCVDAENMLFWNYRFDIILANLSFSVFKRPAKVALMVSRILKPDGRIIASEVNSLSMLGKLGQLFDAVSRNLYYDLFCHRRLTNLFIPYGFRRIRIVKVPLTARLMNHDVVIPAGLSPVFLIELLKPSLLYRGGRDRYPS
jgi:ubiquinone/menaquinone biosynthesis C-methylase UbiE